MSEFDILAVTGNPILHSKSPNMFNCAFEHELKDATYIRLAVDSAKEAITLFKALELKGMNVTAPFKEDIMAELDEKNIDDVAKFIGGVNTIVNKEGILKGFNTDWIGVAHAMNTLDIENIKPLKEFNCLVIGAGGAGKAAAYGLMKHGAKVTIANRTIEKAKQAAEKLSCEYAALTDLQDLVPKSDVIVLALTQNINPIQKTWLFKHHIVFDANYKDSKFIEMAKQMDCTIINATNWLLYQGYQASYHFLGNYCRLDKMEEGLTTTYNLPKKIDKIALVGFMGSGKTTIGKKLAKEMGYSFVDTDDMIVERERKTVSEIFTQNGEAYFRTCEQQVLQSLVNSNERLIISCGGGMAINDENRTLLKKHCLVVWLFASPESTVKRINVETRPLLNVENPLEQAQTLLAERKKYYAQACDMVISTEKFDVEQITDKIYNEIDRITPKQ